MFVSMCRGRRKTVSEGACRRCRLLAGYAVLADACMAEARVVPCSGATPDDDGNVDFEDSLEGMMVTLYKDKKATSFDEKVYKFKLQEAVGGKANTIGVAEVNMADHLNVANTSTDEPLQLMLDLTRTSGVESAALMIELSWGFVKEGKPEDEDVMSTASAEDEIDDHDETLDVSGADGAPGDYDVADDSPRDMRFAVFLQEEGEEELVVNGQPSWTLDECRDAAADQMDARGLWVFMADGAPVDPEEEETLIAGTLDMDADAEDEDAQGMMEEELREELSKTKRDAKLLSTRVQSLERMLEAASAESGDSTAASSADAGMVQVLRKEIDTMTAENTQAMAEKQADLDQKTTQWKQAMDIGQDLVEKNREQTELVEEMREEVEQAKALTEPLELEMAQLKEIIGDHEENAALIEEERQGMEEGRYRITELEGLRDMLEQELRDKDDEFALKLERELETQKDDIDEKYEEDIKWEQKKTADALEKAAADAAEKHSSEGEEMTGLRSQITELQAEVGSVSGELKMERAMAGAHKNEIKKGSAKVSELSKEKKEMIEKIKAKDDAVHKAEAATLAEAKKSQDQTQKNQTLKKELHMEKSKSAAAERELEISKTDLEKNMAELARVSTDASAAPVETGMSMVEMAEMQESIAKEYKGKYEERIKALQHKNVESSKKLKAAETKLKNQKAGASDEQLKAAMAAAAKKANESAEVKQKKMEARLAKKDAALKEQKRKAAMQSGKPQKKKEKVVENLEGFLMKKGDKGIVKKWDWRWFEYDPLKHRLTYYLKEGPKKEYKGFIDLSEKDCKVFVLPNDMQDKCRQSFGINTTKNKKKRTYFLMAGDRKMMTQWVGRLQRECKAWQDNGGKKPPPPKSEAEDGEEAEEGVPPEKAAAEADDLAAATMKANELLAKLNEASDEPGGASAELKKECEAMSDELFELAKKSMKALEYPKASICLKLAIKLDGSNTQAEKLMKQAVQKMAAMDGGLQDAVEAKQKRTADAGKKKVEKKPLKKISMFDDDDDDDDDDGGGIFGD